MGKSINKKIVVPVIIFLVLSAAFFVYKSVGKKTPEESVAAFVDELIEVGEKNSTEEIQNYLDSVGKKSPEEIYRAAELAKEACLKTSEKINTVKVPNNGSKALYQFLVESKSKYARSFVQFADAFDAAMAFFSGSSNLPIHETFIVKYNTADKLLDEAIDDFYFATVMAEAETKNKKLAAAVDQQKENKITETEKLPNTQEESAEQPSQARNSNGLAYENQKYGFSLELPQEWENHYVVDERDEGSDYIISFTYKYDNRIFEDSIVTIIVMNKTKEEVDLENQESPFPMEYIATFNGKSFVYEYNVGDPSTDLANEPEALEELMRLKETVPKTINTFSLK
ncbi:hypothetical protein [Bacillus sp. FJAT-29814]|uniref:hypothetical protein n=1 Tax=Bacillus sp. FJAT-29814 TaxID=1729688 RepID=UPI0008379540|nr:hypothetical protein [Bacillus sp. FJAT-29814]